MKTNQGFIGRIILLIIAVIALKYFLNFDIIEYFKSPQFQSFIQPVKTFLTDAYSWLDMMVRSFVGK